MLPHVLFYFITLAVCCAGAGYKNNIVWGAHIRTDIVKCRSDQSAAAIAFDCFADLFRCGDTYSKVIIFRFDRIGNESGRDQRLSSAVNALIIPIAGNRSNLHQTTETVSPVYSLD